MDGRGRNVFSFLYESQSNAPILLGIISYVQNDDVMNNFKKSGFALFFSLF